MWPGLPGDAVGAPRHRHRPADPALPPRRDAAGHDTDRAGTRGRRRAIGNARGAPGIARADGAAPALHPALEPRALCRADGHSRRPISHHRPGLWRSQPDHRGALSALQWHCHRGLADQRVRTAARRPEHFLAAPGGSRQRTVEHAVAGLVRVIGAGDAGAGQPAVHAVDRRSRGGLTRSRPVDHAGFWLPAAAGGAAVAVDDALVAGAARGHATARAMALQRAGSHAALAARLLCAPAPGRRDVALWFDPPHPTGADRYLC